MAVDGNDRIGHALGDELLVAISRRLRECVRPDDTVARLGGDEFVVLLDGVRDMEEATTIADRMAANTVCPRCASVSTVRRPNPLLLPVTRIVCFMDHSRSQANTRTSTPDRCPRTVTNRTGDAKYD